MDNVTLDRDAIVRRFEAWLDETLSAEAPPQGVDAALLETPRATSGAGDTDANDAAGGRTSGGSASDVLDAHALWSAMTALTHEVKLQGRAFKELQGVLGDQAERRADDPRAAAASVAAAIAAATAARERDVQRETERRCRRDTLRTLIDLRDRLGRGLASVRAAAAAETARPAAARGWLDRLRGQAPATRDIAAETLAALTNGYELGLDRLDQTLDELNAHEISGEGGPFDPRSMNAIEREESTLVPEGTVLEVYQRGYEWNGEVVRPAQVKVSCAPATEQVHE